VLIQLTKLIFGTYDVLAKLERFAALKEKGIISEEEFQAIKKKLLDDMIGIDTGPQKIIIPP
jgi:hypothetical protein